MQFPCHLYYLGRGRVCKYGLASKAAGAFVTLPDANREGRRHVARHLVHSPTQHAWLVFFECVEPPAGGGGGAGARLDGVGSDEEEGDGGGDRGDGGAGADGTARASDEGRWEFCLVKEGLSTSDQGAWFLPGG